MDQDEIFYIAYLESFEEEEGNNNYSLDRDLYNFFECFKKLGEINE